MAELNSTTLVGEFEKRKRGCPKKFRDYVDEEGSSITDAESEKKSDDCVDEERPPNVSAAECDDIAPSRPKRKCEHPKKLDDYEQNTPNSSPISEGSACADHEISLDELLDTLHKTLTTQVSSIHSEPPPSVSHWCTPYNDDCIRKYFKMRRCVVSADSFIVRYLYAGVEPVHQYEEVCFAKELKAIQDLLEECTSCIDVTEAELFLPSKCAPGSAHAVYRGKFCDILTKRSLDVLHSTHLDGVNFTKYLNMAVTLKGNLKQWMETLVDAVTLSPSAVRESTYEEVFKQYLKVFPIRFLNGNSAKLGIPYRKIRVSSVPDIIFRRDESNARYFAVVEWLTANPLRPAEQLGATSEYNTMVKKMTLDPTLKHAYEEPPKHGILINSDEGPKPQKKRCVNFPEGATTSSTTEALKEEDEQQNALDLGGSPLTNSQRLFIKLFFGQLFGHVLALDCCPRGWCYPYGRSDFPQRVGIGVVGFRVVFFSFSSNPDVPFQEVPCVGSHRTDVYMTSVLSLLKASDRKEITKILLALSTNDPHKPQGESDDED